MTSVVRYMLCGVGGPPWGCRRPESETKMKQQRISGKEAARVAEDMAKPGPIRVVAASEAQEAPGALVPSSGSELDRKMRLAVLRAIGIQA
jgi:hypothetical protein